MSAETATTGTESGRRRRYTPEPVRTRFSADKRHAQLLDVARELIADQGLAALTIERLAATAGVSRGLAYHHFANASDVALELLEAEWAWLEDRISAGLVDAVTFEDKIRAVARPHLEAKHERSRAFSALLLSTPSDETVLAALRKYRLGTLDFWLEEVVKAYGLNRYTARSALTVLVPGWRTATERYWSTDYLDPDELLDLYVVIVTSALKGLARRNHARPT